MRRARYRRLAQDIYRDRFDELAAMLKPRGLVNPVFLNTHPDVNVDRFAPVMAERARAALETIEEVALSLAEGR